MKFTYQYKISGGERRSGVCSAPNKDSVFVILKKSGIKPFDVKPAPGIENRILSIGKRGFLIVALSLGCVFLSFLVFQRRQTGADTVLDTFDSMVRRQVIGDASIIDQGVRTGWANVFRLKGDRFLASFAIPGVVGGVTSCSEEELITVLKEELRHGELEPSKDGIEARQIRAIVSGMKIEAREFIDDGGGLSVYMRRLVQRQQEEIRLYARAKNEIEKIIQTGTKSEAMKIWEKRNAELKRLGIKTVRMPSEFSEEGYLTD